MYRNKYHNKKTIVDGITFDSKKEARRYSELKLLVRAKEISNLELQPKFMLIDKYTNGNGKKVRALTYVADFQYTTKYGIVVEDVKGMKTDVYKLKKKLFERIYAPLTITEI